MKQTIPHFKFRYCRRLLALLQTFGHGVQLGAVGASSCAFGRLGFYDQAHLHNLGRARVLDAPSEVVGLRGFAVLDKGPAADMTNDTASVFQLLQRAADRVARDTVVIRQRALSGNALTGLPTACVNRFSK